MTDLPMPPPWPPSGAWDEERECSRCGGTIPPKWRHYMRPCVCTYTPTDQPPHEHDPECPHCDYGYLPCEPQDLNVLRRSGACAECGAWSFVLINDDGEIPGSARHYDDEADHVVTVTAAPLVRAVGETLDRGESQ